MRLALMLGAAAAILVCLAVVVTWEDQFPVSMISALRAKGEAKQLDKLSNGSMERSRQEDTDAKRDMVLASKDARIKGSLMLAAGQQQKNLKEEEVKARKSISDIQHLRNDAGMLAEALLGARRDMREAGQEMHGHFSETERILGGIKALDAEHQKLAADDFRLAKGVEQARKEVMPQLQQVQRANGIIAGAEAARIRVANKARMSQGQTRYEVDEEKLLSAKAKVLRKSAILLEQHSEVMAGRADVAKAKRLQAMSENAKQYAALLGAKAQEASSYVQLLSADLVSAEGRANQEREKLALLRREYFRGSRMEAEAWRKQQILRGEEEEGVRAVKVNEAAFRSDVQRYAGDHHAIGVGTPKLVADEKAWNMNVAMLQSEQGEIKKDGRALATDERQAMLLQKASVMHSAAADSLEAASHADRRDASRLQAHAKHLQELSKLDYQDVKDSSALEALESVQHE